MKRKSGYLHEVYSFLGRNIISIIDTGGPMQMSVTNNIENVIEEIEYKEQIDAKQYMIVYRDSDGTWDGWDEKKHDFISLNCKDVDDAVRKYISKQIEL